MNNLNKRMMVLSVVFLLGLTTFAQKSLDLAITVTVSPAVVNFGDSLKFTIKITNNGPVDLTSGDTCGFTINAANAKVSAFVGPLAKGASANYVLGTKHTDETLTADATGDVCFLLLPQSALKRQGDNGAITKTYVDTFAKNDTSCVTLTLKKKPVVGINSSAYVAASVLRLYPNPATTRVSFDVRLATPGLVDASIRDVAGKIIQVKHYGALMGDHALAMDVSALPAGLYFMEVHAGNGKHVEKLLIRNR